MPQRIGPCMAKYTKTGYVTPFRVTPDERAVFPTPHTMLKIGSTISVNSVPCGVTTRCDFRSAEPEPPVVVKIPDIAHAVHALRRFSDRESSPV